MGARNTTGGIDMRNLLFCLTITAVSVLMNYGFVEAEAGMIKPEINLSTVIPVVNQELEIRLDGLPSDEKEVVFSLTGEGKEIIKEKIASVNGKIVKKWTPTKTGFYTARFEYGAKNASNKISFEFPVVWRELYFICWPPLDQHKEPDKTLRYFSSYVICLDKKSDQYLPYLAYWKSKGSKVLMYTGGWLLPDGTSHDSLWDTEIYKDKTENEAIDEKVKQWSAPMKNGFDGIFIDEFGSYPNPKDLRLVGLIARAFLKLRKENPDMLIFPAISGALLPEESISYKFAGCVALLESYEYCWVDAFGTHNYQKYLEQRIETARNTDLIYEKGRKHAAIILLGSGGTHEDISAAQVEDQVRYIKKTAPEMPGIGFYSGKRKWLTDMGIYELAEDVALKYYIKPVIDVRDIWFSDYAPSAGKELEIFARIHNLGGMDAKGVKVKLYANSVGGGRKQIGEKVIKKIGCGFVTVKRTEKGKSDESYEYYEINGNKHGLFYDSTSFSIDRTTVRMLWKPVEKGYYTITAEVEPSDNYTILDGVMKKDICVTGKGK